MSKKLRFRDKVKGAALGIFIVAMGLIPFIFCVIPIMKGLLWL